MYVNHKWVSWFPRKRMERRNHLIWLAWHFTILSMDYELKAEKTKNHYRDMIFYMKVNDICIHFVCILGVRRIEPSHYEEKMSTHFGEQVVRGIQLCSMDKPKSDSGYYHVEHEIKFSVWALVTKDGDDTECCVRPERRARNVHSWIFIFVINYSCTEFHIFFHIT